MTKPMTRQQTRGFRAPVCPYCDRASVLVGGNAIYPHRPDLIAKKFYLCKPCDAYVGCHPDTVNPLGRLANADLRKAKQQAHAVFDPIWKSRKKRRTDAYKWLADSMGIAPQNCHIGMFDVDQRRAVIAICKGATL